MNSNVTMSVGTCSECGHSDVCCASIRVRHGITILLCRSCWDELVRQVAEAGAGSFWWKTEREQLQAQTADKERRIAQLAEADDLDSDYLAIQVCELEELQAKAGEL